MEWEAIRSFAAVISAVCAIVAAGVSVAVWRKARSSDLGTKIESGDKAIKAHADQAIGKLEETVVELEDKLGEFGAAIARIEAHQETEGAHVLRPRDLGAIHEKINVVAHELAATRAQSQTETRMLSEQLRVIQDMLMKRMERGV
jgi:septal ring factor EnvC (AmiA/AmiB activator)